MTATPAPSLAANVRPMSASRPRTRNRSGPTRSACTSPSLSCPWMASEIRNESIDSMPLNEWDSVR